MARHTFFCIDGHTCGNPVRVVTGGSIPQLRRRDHVRASAAFSRRVRLDPDGSDVRAARTRHDVGLDPLPADPPGLRRRHPLHRDVRVPADVRTRHDRHRHHRDRERPDPAQDSGTSQLDTPAGLVEARYEENGPFVESVRITNVPSFLYGKGYEVDVEGLGTLTVDVAYGGNFYAIVEQTAALFRPRRRQSIRYPALEPQAAHGLQCAPQDFPSRQSGDRPIDPRALDGRAADAGRNARNAVFYGDKAIDRSPCGTGTSARMAHLAAQGRLMRAKRSCTRASSARPSRAASKGEAQVGNLDAIMPSIEGWARVTGCNTIVIDDRDPFAHGFQVVDR